MEGERELLAEYGQWRKDETVADGKRSSLLAEMVLALLRQSLPWDAVQLVDLDGGWAVEFDFEGRDYLVSFALDAGKEERTLHRAIGSTIRAAGLTGRSEGARWAVVYWSDDRRVPDSIVESVTAFGVVLDRTNLDAALTGLHSLAQLIRDVFRRRLTHVPLADLLTTGGPAPQVWGMTPRARLTFPFRVETQTWAGATAEVLLVGQAQQDRPTGLACLSQDRVLITCSEGLLEVDTVRGNAHWNLTLPGCHGPVLVRPNGDLLVMCGSALVCWSGGRLTAVAGGFEAPSVLVSGPDDEAWVLSGSGATLGVGTGNLALTRVGDAAGDQLRFPITFNASVLSAVWLERRRFFLAAPGHSAVLGLARTTDAGQREEWIPTPVHFPDHVLRVSVDSVLSASPDGTGGGIGVHRTDITSRNSCFPVPHAA
ncbi:hypothetical protein ACFXMT_46340 [Streptomyces mirabilis]|uniref:hypothetical protein n=1 Tax=Streptomyces mirabilis TaxID=68239 RepID=UPI0036B9EA30